MAPVLPESPFFGICSKITEANLLLASQRYIHRKCFRNLIKSNRNLTVYTIFRWIWNQTDIRLIPNQSEDGEYNNKSSKIFLCVYTQTKTITAVLETRVSRYHTSPIQGPPETPREIT